MEMRNVYEMTQLNTYYQVMEDTIALNAEAIYKSIFKQNLPLIGNLFVDWLLTVGLSKIPLSFSGHYIQNLVLYGWPFVMKFFASFIKELETQCKDLLQKIKRNVKQVTLYNNFDVEHLSEEVRRSISPIKKRKKLRAFRNLFSRKKKTKQDEIDDQTLKTEKRIFFTVKNSKNVLANEDIYLVLKKKIKKFDDETWERIFVAHGKCKINRKKLISDLKWTKAQNFAFLN